MLKWLAVLSVAFILLVNPGKKDGSLGLAKNNNDNQTTPSAASLENNQICYPNAETANAQPPHWYASPEWWLCILGVPTLIFLGWQANETRKAAEATKKAAEASEKQSEVANAALIAQFRPKVVVRSVRLDPPATIYYARRGDGIWKIGLQLTNVGESIAHIKNCDTWFQIYSAQGSPMETICGETWDQEILLAPGGRHSFDLIVPPERFTPTLHSMEFSFNQTKRQMRWPMYHGTITYADGNGFERKTGFARQWNVGTQRFDTVDNPEFEYAD